MNVSKNKNCYGCGVCAIACPFHIINMNLNDEGFLEPSIDLDKCIDCGLCSSVCSFNNEKLCDNESNEILGYASWSLNAKNRRKSSSGGIAYELARDLITKGYKICAVKYNVVTRRAEHYIARTEKELDASQGSKYIQSYTLKGLEAINWDEKYAIIGTPCMIDSMRRLINKKHVGKNFILIDFLCHGVPSYLLWNKYLNMQESKLGDIKKVSFRYGENGWHDSLKMHLEADKDYSGGLCQDDIFFKLFLGDYCLNRACYRNCKFKMQNTSADIRIGDLWGNTYSNYEEGVSGVLLATEKGKKIFLEAQNIYRKKECENIVMEGQMYNTPSYPFVRLLLLKLMKKNNNNFMMENIIIKIDKAIKKIKKIFLHPNIVMKNRLMR